ncbi:MAG: ATP-binding cassette domain-containing protein [Thermoguttaceae bacterium]|nr:ATP-binding cassette domain-containing protein [Thermoguttaceae bacterium]
MGTAIEVNHVWKKFYRGEFNDSLRDAIPAMLKSMVGLGPSRTELQKGDFWALKDVDFKVEEGESVALIGHNGAGKSTLLKIFSKILKPNRGNIKVNGRMRALIEIGSGFHGDLTGRENIFLNGSILGMSRKEIASKFDAIVDFAGIEDFLDMPVKRYSSGMYARLGFAVAAHLEPEILIVDEVLSVGDAAFQKKCLGKMNEVAHEGRTVIFVSHNMAAVRNLCQRSILFDHGTMVMDGPTKDVVEKYYYLLRQQQHDLQTECDNIKDRKAYITKVLMGTNPDNLTENATCYTNGPLYIRIYFHVNQPLNISNLNIVFINSDEEHLIGFNSYITEKQIGYVEHGGYIQYYVPHTPFTAGRYLYGAALFEYESVSEPRKRLSHFAPDNYLDVMHIDMPSWNFSKGYSQKFFAPYSWDICFDEYN